MENKSNQGIGIFGILGVVFVILKLTGYIDWSWWWVTVPFWGVLTVQLLAAIIVYLIFKR